jgi:hypothetical protein
MATSKRSQFLQSLYHHIVLPRAVPGCEDSNLFSIEADLLDRLTAAVKALIPHLPLNNQAIVDSVRLSLSTAKALNVEGKIDKHILAKELQNLSGKNMLILHVTEQNAGLLVYRQARYVKVVIFLPPIQSWLSLWVATASCSGLMLSQYEKLLTLALSQCVWR